MCVCVRLVLLAIRELYIVTGFKSFLLVLQETVFKWPLALWSVAMSAALSTVQARGVRRSKAIPR